MADVYKQSFKQNYTNNIELSIFNCGLERCAPGQTWGPGIRDHYLIHLVVSGKGTFEVGGKTFEVVPGDLFFARPSQLIRYSADEQQPWEYSWVGFNGASQTGGTAALYRHCSCASHAGPGRNAGSPDQHLFFPRVRASG